MSTHLVRGVSGGMAEYKPTKNIYNFSTSHIKWDVEEARLAGRLWIKATPFFFVLLFRTAVDMLSTKWHGLCLSDILSFAHTSKLSLSRRSCLASSKLSRSPEMFLARPKPSLAKSDLFLAHP